MMSSSSAPCARVKKYKVLIVDDHPIVRQGLSRFVSQEPDIEVCGGADGVSDALAMVEKFQPDLVLVDITLKESNGIELISRIKAHHEATRTLVWSMFDEQIYAERALRAGAMGYINKREPIENVVAAVRQVLHGEMYLSPQMTNQILRRLSGSDTLEEDPVATLSNRELEVFQLIGRGRTSQQIARQLGVKPKTIDAHREKIKKKLKIHNVAELHCRAVQWVLENG